MYSCLIRDVSFVENSSMVEPLGGCGKKVMMWWLRSEARAYSKFPVGLFFIAELIFSTNLFPCSIIALHQLVKINSMLRFRANI